MKSRCSLTVLVKHRMQLHLPITEGLFPGYKRNMKLLLREGKIAITISTRNVSQDTSTSLVK